jgi:NFU1 iron-sulfur cluster scaffold homolog, mitochondrial
MHQVITQGTPNPNALKFVTAKDVKSTGKITFNHPAECLTIPLAADLLGTTGVVAVHFFENVITVTQDGSRDWPELEDEVIEVILRDLPDHNPDFQTFGVPKRQDLTPELQKIEDILDREIRPGLQADGGDIEVVEYADNILTVRYEGACGSCPSSRYGTLQGIEGILRHEFNPEIQIAAL